MNARELIEAEIAQAQRHENGAWDAANRARTEESRSYWLGRRDAWRQAGDRMRAVLRGLDDPSVQRYAEAIGHA